jgi:hypothetical protein
MFGVSISVHETVLLLTQLLVDTINRVNTTVCSMCIENSEMFWKHMQDSERHIPYHSILSNVRNNSPSDTASHPRSTKTPAILLWQPQTSQNALTFSSYCPSTPCSSSLQSRNQSPCPNLVAAPCCNWHGTSLCPPSVPRWCVSRQGSACESLSWLHSEMKHMRNMAECSQTKFSSA